MKVKFYCDSGANIHSRRQDTIDTEKYLGLNDEEWKALSDDEKQEIVNDWANESLSIGWEDID